MYCAICFRCSVVPPSFGDEEKLLAEEDRAGVLHRAGGEIGHGDDVELLERIFDREVPVEIPQRELRRLEREAELVFSIRACRRCGWECRRRGRRCTPSRRRPARRGTATCAWSSRTVSVCLPAPGPGVSDSRRPFEIAVSLASIVAETAKVAFIAGSSNDGNARRASVGLELRDGVVAVVRAAQIEAAQLVVEPARCSESRSRPRRQESACGTVSVAVSVSASRVTLATCCRSAGGNRHLVKIDFGGVQRDRSRRLLSDARVMRDLAGERVGREIGCEVNVVVLRNDGPRQPLRRRDDGPRRQQHHGRVASRAFMGYPSRWRTGILQRDLPAFANDDDGRGAADAGVRARAARSGWDRSRSGR